MMNQPTLRRSVIALAVSWMMFSGGSVRGQTVQTFDADPNWEDFRNRLLPDELPIARQDFGYLMSNLAGGGSAGEIGGTIQRAHRRAYYAKVIKPKTLDDKFSASGRFSVRRAGGGSGVLIGWFNHQQSHGWRTPSSLGFRIDGNGGKYWIFYEYGTTNRATGGAGAFEGERYQTTTTIPFADDGTAHEWSLDYDPEAANRLGLLVLRIDSQEYRLPLHPDHKEMGATFDRFGIWSQQTPGDTLELYLDDLQLDGESESFDVDPQWAEEGNHFEYQQRVLRPYHDFGFSKTSYTGGKPGEIGGIIFRDEQPAYFADRVGPFTLDDELTASGKFVFRTAGVDCGVMLGWFNSKSKQTKKTPEHEEPQSDYLGIMLEGPSRVGHYFRAAYSTSTGQHEAPTYEGQPKERPIVLPDGRVREWSLQYQPAAAGGGRGQITVTLDGESQQLDLSPSAREENAQFDRFGLFNIQSGGHHVEVYLDDLRYSR